MRLVITLLVAATICGCSMAQIRETVGPGMTASEVKNAANKRVETVNINSGDCVVMIKDIVGKLQANVIRVEAKDSFILTEGYEKCFKACINTTQVGILLIPLEQGKTRIEIYSGNYSLAAYVADRLVKRLKGIEPNNPIKRSLAVKGTRSQDYKG